MLFFLFILCAQAQSISKNMLEVSESMRGLIPYMLSSHKYAAPTNRSEVLSKLSKLEDLFKRNETHFIGKGEERLVTREIMLGVLGQARRLYQEGKPELSRQVFKTSPELCFSCHTQDHVNAKVLYGFPEKFESDLETAEFLMITRRPKQAETYLAKFLLAPHASDAEQVKQALRDELRLSIYQNRPWKEVKAHFAERLKQTSFDPSMKVMLGGWLKGIEAVDGVFDGRLKSVHEVKALLVRLNGAEPPSFGLLAEGPREVVYMKLRNSLHELINQAPPEKDLPEIFYWLALSERAVGYNYLYSLSDAYLKKCITRWPKSPFATKCLDEYEEFVNFAYTGSAGTSIPKDVNLELERLHRLVRPQKKR